MVRGTSAEAMAEEADPLKSIADAVRDAISTASEDATKARERISEVGEQARPGPS